MKIFRSIFWQQRVFEIIPGFLVWSTLGLSIILSFVKPLWAISFIIVFDLYWVIRVLYLATYIIISWKKLRHSQTINHYQELVKNYPDKYQDYYHLIFLPFFEEDFSVIDKTFANLASVNYDLKKLIIVLAGEGRRHENFVTTSGLIYEKYHDTFYKLYIFEHPTDLPDEIPGKGSNLNYAGNQVKKQIDLIGLAYDKIIVSSFDVDTRPSSQYFAYLTKTFLDQPNPYHCSYQPVALYHNNFWESDILTRVVANSTTFWLLTDMSRSDRLFTFSSHSMSWQTLVDINFWQKEIVTEDSRLFLQGFYRYHGDYRTVPMYISVSMNTVYMGSWKRSLINQYKQMRRWAWGVEHFPYMIAQNRLHSEISWLKKFRYLWNQTEGVYSWATAPLLITILGRLPLWVASKGVQATALAQNAPKVLEVIMNAGLLGLVLVAVLNTITVPAKPKNKSAWVYLQIFFQWLLFPITMVVFGSIPATDAQTRLMLGGKYRLGFWVTEKK